VPVTVASDRDQAHLILNKSSNSTHIMWHTQIECWHEWELYEATLSQSNQQSKSWWKEQI